MLRSCTDGDPALPFSVLQQLAACMDASYSWSYGGSEPSSAAPEPPSDITSTGTPARLQSQLCAEQSRRSSMLCFHSRAALQPAQINRVENDPRLSAVSGRTAGRLGSVREDASALA